MADNDHWGFAALEDKVVQHAVGRFSNRYGTRTFWVSHTGSGQGAVTPCAGRFMGGNHTQESELDFRSLHPLIFR